MTAVDRFAAWAMEPRSVAGVVAFRVVLAAWTAAFFAARLPYLEELYTRPVLRTAIGPLAMLPVPSVWMVQVLVAVLGLALLAFAFGRRARAAHVVIVACLVVLFTLETQQVRAYGSIALLSWCLLWLAPYDRLRDENGDLVLEPGWGTVLLQLQFASVYGLSVVAKLGTSSQWLNGKLLYWVSRNPNWGDLGWTAGGLSRELSTVLGIATIGLEAFIALGLWHRRTRPLAMLAVVAFHLGLATGMRISLLFGALMIGHLVLFVPVDSRSAG